MFNCAMIVLSCSKQESRSLLIRYLSQVIAYSRLKVSLNFSGTM